MRYPKSRGSVFTPEVSENESVGSAREDYLRSYRKRLDLRFFLFFRVELFDFDQAVGEPAWEFFTERRFVLRSADLEGSFPSNPMPNAEFLHFGSCCHMFRP